MSSDDASERIAVLERRLVRERKAREEAEAIAESQTRRSFLVEQELAAINEMLGDFAYAASHDLRAPLRAIKSVATWLREDLQGKLSDESATHMQFLVDRVDRMDALLVSLLEYSKAGTAAPAEPVDLRSLVEDITILLAPPKGFEVQVTDEVGPVEVPRAVLHQILQNLMDNALKHHDRDSGTLRIDFRNKGSLAYELVVSDDGPGIPEAYHDRVFRLFQTLRPRDEVEGTGMGLALVKRHVEGWGGTIALESGPSRGATFRITWPKQRSRGTI